MATGETGTIARPGTPKLVGGNYHIRHRDGLLVVSAERLYLFHAWRVERENKQDHTEAQQAHGGDHGGYNWPDD